MAVIVNFSLDPEKDKDLLRWLGKQTNRSATIREALRSYMAKEEGVTLADVLAEIRALPSKFSVVATTTTGATPEGEEPQAAAENLNGLLDRLGNGDLG